MDQLPASREIGEITLPTIQLYAALQRARKEEIFSADVTEHQYGSHPRQKLDLFLPVKNSEDPDAKLACVIFFYGGGLVRGAKRMPPADGAIYGNVGEFFSKQGIVCAIVDYRLFGTHEDAIYPSGGEDVALATDWVLKNARQVDPAKVFLVGNSAGGVHVATSLWSPDLSPSIPRPSVRAAILISVPVHFHSATEDRKETLDGYFKGGHLARCPFALRKSSKDQTPTLIVLAEKDPEGEILGPNRELLSLFPLDDVPTPEVFPTIAGHNHISPLMALGLGGEEDAWGFELVKWIKEQK